jgi:formate-nitrite transporter family protein
LDFASPLLFAAAAVAADMMKKRSPQKQHRSEPAEAGESFAPAGKLDNLSRKQKREVDEQSRPNAALIHETIRAEGESELERTWWALGLSGLAAGLSIGFSMVLQGELHAHLPDGAAVKTIAPFGYTAGFVIVVLGRQQLFTENTLTPILPLLHNRDLPTARKVLALWAMVLATNIAGAFLFAAAIIHSHAFEAAITSAFSADARHLVEGSFGVTVVRAILAGWLIALMVWLLPAAESSRLLVIIFITYIIGLCGFSTLSRAWSMSPFCCKWAKRQSAISSSDFSSPRFLATSSEAWRWSQCSVTARSCPRYAARRERL